jgi:DNA polymerase elongation subunit (family B)
MALLEADTDGVYFAAPLGWTEEQERQVVTKVGSLLPDGIRLEYEGRYQAMFVHEVKNYALLTYGGDLIVRGGALTATDVAIQARLTKTPEEYETSRKRAREAAYEALLTAGRRTWQVGERVRFYKAVDGTVVWLPDERDDLSGATSEEDADEDRANPSEESRENPIDRRDYDIAHYLQVLLTSYVGRLRIQPLWIRCQEQDRATVLPH